MKPLPNQLTRVLEARDGPRAWCRCCGVLIRGSGPASHKAVCVVPHLSVREAAWKRDALRDKINVWRTPHET